MSFHLMPELADQLLKIDRRGFLTAATALALASPIQNAEALADSPPGWIALLSDTHVDADAKMVVRGQSMAKNLERVVAEILLEKTRPLAVFIDGDLALKDGQAGDYRTFLKLLEPIRAAKLPIHLALGNHDDRDKFRQTLKGVIPTETRVEEKQVGVVECLGLRLFVLDSLDEPNVTPGFLGAKQLAWLAKELDAKASTPTLIFVHHNLKGVAEASLTDQDALLEILRPRMHVKGVVFGHTHVWDTRQSEGISFINLPAIGYPFTENQPIGWSKLTPSADGATLELRAIGGDESKPGEVVKLAWRKS